MDKDNNILFEDFSERIESFLRGTMSAEEEIAFKQEIKENPELHNQAKAMTLLIRGLQTKNKATEKAIIQENTIPAAASIRPKTRPIILWWACSIAAMFILIFGVTTLWNKQSDTDALFNQYYTSYDTSLSRGGDDETIIIELADLYNKIETEKDMTPIITRLQTIYNNIQANNEDGIDYYFYENDIAWYLALAYVKDSQIDKAKSILEKIKQDNPDTPLCRKAEELIKKLSV